MSVKWREIEHRCRDLSKLLRGVAVGNRTGDLYQQPVVREV